MPTMPIHLLYGCCAVQGCLAAKYLDSVGINLDTITRVKMVHRPDMTVSAVIKDANLVSMEFGQNAVVSEAVLFVLSTQCLQTVEVLEAFGEGTCKKLVAKILIDHGIDPNNLTTLSTKKASVSQDFVMAGDYVEENFNPFGADSTNNEKRITNNDGINSALPTDMLKLGADLTAKAKAGKIDNIIGRDEETSRVIEILCRKTKNNPVLIGEAGVGKSAIVEGLALRIAKDNVPELLKNKTIFSLDIGSLMAGTKFRGELEQRLENVIQLVTKRDDIILFIDELHTITTATGKEGEIGISEMLKPRLARGEMQTIGATTTEEYRKFIEKDAALERRFQPIIVNPPTAGQTIEILRGLKTSYEKFHGVNIGDDAIVAAVSLSDRYINDRNLPDKAIDMLDEACAKAKIAKSIAAAGAAASPQKSRDATPYIAAEHIAEVVAKTTGVPVTKMTGTDRENLIHLEDELKKEIIGQDKAISFIAKAIRRSRAGVGDPNRPVGSFMFLGRTGVGKTEVCKVLAKNLFATERSLIKLDMSEFTEAHSVSKLIGAPPGYVGFDEGSAVIERVRRNPYCIVLFDEIEKAHSDIYNVLLQILDEGRLTDNRGKTTSFKNAIIIMTSNAGVEGLGRTAQIGFASGGDTTSREEDIIMAGIKKRFKPEFINRIDNIVVFNSLSKDDVAKIAKLRVDDLVRKLEGVGVSLHVDSTVVTHLVDKGYSSEYGARPLKRVIQTELEDKIAEEILAREKAKTCRVTMVGGEVRFEFR